MKSTRSLFRRFAWPLLMLAFAFALPGASGTEGGWMFIDFLVIAAFGAMLVGLFYEFSAERWGWRPLLAVLVIALAALMLWYPGRYGPSQRLKLGLDLKGGTTLVYAVNIPPEQAAHSQEVMENTIAALKKRLDPNGLMNLSFQPQGANRIEIQMALAPEEVKRRRAALSEAREKLLASNINVRDLDAAVRSTGAAQQNLLQRLAGSNAQKQQQIQELASAYAAREEAFKPYEQLQKQMDELEEHLRQNKAASDADRAKLTQQRDELRKELIAATQQYVSAKAAYDQARAGVLSGNLEAAKLDQVLALPNKAEKNQASARAKAFDELAKAFPTRAADLRQVQEAAAAYDRIRGPLDDYNDLIALLRGSGVLEFRIAAAPGAARAANSVADEAQYRQDLEQKGPRVKGKPWRWFKLDNASAFADTPEKRQQLSEDAVRYFMARGMVGQSYGGEPYVLLSDDPTSSLTRAKEGWQLTHVGFARDGQGFPAVSFQLNPLGGQFMADLTGNHINQQMAIVLDGRVVSAPVINSRISDSGIITGGGGGFGPEELRYLVRTLGAGSLQATLSNYPISIDNVNATLGEDNITRGLTASVFALVAVSFFMLVYYFFGGLVAIAALAANMLLILGGMALFQGTLTMPGIAGIVLTIGMTVDANVLIYERVREELEAGNDLETALRLGYDKAFVTIIDSNLTNLITCLVLYYLATTEVKSFAITLGLGILATLFTAVFCTRILFKYWLQYAKPTTMRMLPMVVPAVRRAFTPNFDWVGNRVFIVGASVVLMVGSVAAVVWRGHDIFDIEFRSGTQVTFELKPGAALSRNEFTTRLEKAGLAANLPDLARASVQSLGTLDAQGRARQFKLSTLVEDAREVSRVIQGEFKDVLDIRPPAHFAGAPRDAAPAALAQAPVYAIRSQNLGEVLQRPDLSRDDQESLTSFVGGVAIALNDLSPALSTTDIQERLQRTRQQLEFQSTTGRQIKVLGLDAAGSGPDGQTLYRSAVILSHDDSVNYADDLSGFTDADGLAGTEWNLALAALTRESSLGSVSNFSSSVSNTMQQQAVAAMAVSLLAVSAYIWFRFGNLRYGVAALASLFHDVLIGVGAIAISSALPMDIVRIDLVVIGALLTLVGYSLNDTIVVFDRIRENKGRLSNVSVKIVNDAINQTISRTILTSGTTFLAVVVLYLFGGDGVRGFSYTMTVGVIVGTYSSIAIAANILLLGLPTEPTAPSVPAAGELKTTAS